MNLYVIVDVEAEQSGPIFEARNDAVALRMFAKFLQENKQFEAPFEIWYVGEIDHDVVGGVPYGCDGHVRRVEVNLNQVKDEVE